MYQQFGKNPAKIAIKSKMKGSPVSERVTKCYELDRTTPTEQLFSFNKLFVTYLKAEGMKGEFNEKLLAFPLVGVLGSTLNGNSIKLGFPRDDFIQPPCFIIYGCGGTGVGKSQAYGVLAKGITEVQRQWGEQFVVNEATPAAVMGILGAQASRTKTINDYIALSKELEGNSLTID